VEREKQKFAEEKENKNTNKREKRRCSESQS